MQGSEFGCKEENFHGAHGEHGDKKSIQRICSSSDPVFPVPPVEILHLRSEAIFVGMTSG